MQFIRDIFAARMAAKQPACVADPGCAGGYAEARASNLADARGATDRKSEIEMPNTPARRGPARGAEADSAIAAANKLEAKAMDPNTSAQRRPVISFEFSPPKTGEGDRNLLEKHIPALSQARPDFCSVTYGAGGSTRDKTLMIVDRIQRQHHLTALAHLTCVNHARDEVRALLEKIRALGCKNILALRGDPPGGGEFQPTPGGFEFASQLVKFIRESGDFSIGVAGFPEGHIACKEGKHADWRHLREKVDAGADFVLSQLFFDNADYFGFRDFVAGKLGVRVPLVPGIVPILSAAQITKFTQLCGAKIPPPLRARLDQLGGDDEATVEFGIEYATRQCEELLRAGAPGLHFYTLNKSHSTVQVLKNLGLAK